MSELLRSAFVDFYRLDYNELFWLLAAATGCFLVLHEKCRDRLPWKMLVGAGLLGWTALVVYSTVGSRGDVGIGRYSLIPFHSYREIWAGGNPEIYRSNLMNVVLFYPNGLLAAALLPEKWPKWSKILVATAVFAALSSGIEYAQYLWQLGRVEIDDVIHNTAGALLGSFAAMISLEKLSRITGRDK